MRRKSPRSGGEIVRITGLRRCQEDNPLIDFAIQQSALSQRQRLHNRGRELQPPVGFQRDKHRHTPFGKIRAKNAAGIPGCLNVFRSSPPSTKPADGRVPMNKKRREQVLICFRCTFCLIAPVGFPVPEFGRSRPVPRPQAIQLYMIYKILQIFPCCIWGSLPLAKAACPNKRFAHIIFLKGR